MVVNGYDALKVAVLLSGSGRTLQNFIDCIDAGSLKAKIVLVIGSRSDAYGLERARKAGIPAVTVSRRNFRDEGRFSEAIDKTLGGFELDLILLAGFMHKLKVDRKYRGRIMNIHPALIPAFCGKGYYGELVHKAVLEKGVKVTGCTVHFVDEDYDHGPIILQEAVPVMEGDTPHTLAERVFREECSIYPKAVQLFAEGRLKINDGRVEICSG